MASTLHQNLSFIKPQLSKPSPIAAATTTSYAPIRCGGPRSQRGPLVKGRILSIEAIQAIQTLKRVHKSNPTDPPTQFLSRLIKADLLATLRELLRQDQCVLALHVLSTFRSEYQPDLSLYADVASALARNGMGEDIDRLIADLETENGGGIPSDDAKGLIKLVKAVIVADRRESTVRIYEMMKRSGWGSSFEADDYVVKVLSKGLKRLGEEGLANEVVREFGTVSSGNLDKLKV